MVTATAARQAFNVLLCRLWRRPAKARIAAEASLDVSAIPHLRSQVLCRPLGHWFFADPPGVGEAVIFRVFSDERRRPGDRLELEVAQGGGDPLVFRCRVLGVQAIADARPARYDVALESEPIGEDLRGALGALLAHR